MDTDDELGELGDAFNSMSKRLAQQFTTAQSFSEIDNMILEREDLDVIIITALEHCRLLVPALQFHALLLDRSDSTRGRRLSLPGPSSTAGDGPKFTSTDVSVNGHPNLSALTVSELKANGETPGWTEGIDVLGPAAQWIAPLVWGDVTGGWLWLVGQAETDLIDDDRRLICDLAGRMALAIAATWRDDELYQQSHYDRLTGLPNRLLFDDRLEREIARGTRESTNTAVLFIDLDHFKSVNDSQGHSAGDRLLCDAAQRIIAAVRDIDTVSRHGGDEFTVLLVDIADQRDALRAAEAIVSALSKPFKIGKQECFLSASVGIALHPTNGGSAEELLKNADIAMYRAKAAGRGQAMFFEEKMNAETIARITIDRELRTALTQGEFELHFQPLVLLATNRVVAAEALLRWNHPQRGLLEPAAFIAVAEETGLICAIGKWVIERACEQFAQWRTAGIDLARITVNVSARQLRDADFVDHIMKQVVAAGLASAIEIEITETAMIERVDLVRDKLKTLADAGCRIALDDFGTGFSSLGYLKQLPVNVIKVDRSFVEDIDHSADALTFVKSIIAMAHAMGKIVVAEGVETERQVELLRALGCDIVQGFHNGRPAPASDLPSLIAKIHGGVDGGATALGAGKPAPQI